MILKDSEEEFFEGAAEHCGWLGEDGRPIHERTLARYALQGLPYVTRGRKRLFCRRWTIEWLKGRKVALNTPRGRRAA
jgi:hypothetical protein